MGIFELAPGVVGGMSATVNTSGIQISGQTSIKFTLGENDLAGLVPGRGWHHRSHCGGQDQRCESDRAYGIPRGVPDYAGDHRRDHLPIRKVETDDCRDAGGVAAILRLNPNGQVGLATLQVLVYSTSDAHNG